MLHYTAMTSAEAALERMCDPAIEVSAHYLIGRDGRIWQLVDEGQRAWHAGAGSWGGCSDVNSHSVGIELDNDGASPFSEPLMRSLEGLLPGILDHWKVPPERVIGHSDMAPGRKIDPGRRFDWQRLALSRLAHAPRDIAGDGNASVPAEPDPSVDLATAFNDSLLTIGYPPDVAPDALLDAFRSRFRQQARGPLCPQDLALARRLAAAFPVDRRPQQP